MPGSGGSSGSFAPSGGARRYLRPRLEANHSDHHGARGQFTHLLGRLRAHGRGLPDGGPRRVVSGALARAVAFYFADREVNGRGGSRRKNPGNKQGDSATAIAIGALMDGIPELAAINISLLGGGEISAALVAAVFLSNVPEGLSSASGMKQAGRSTAHILGLWSGVTLVSALAALLGYFFLAGASENLLASIQAFAAGAILTMLASTMMPEAYDEGGQVVGLVTAIGFLLSFVLSHLE